MPPRSRSPWTWRTSTESSGSPTPPRELTTHDATEPAAAKAGDLAYYAPWDNLALFYKNGPSASADLLILGHINADADQLAEARRLTIETAP
ncbi:cyclophilin-like fold protein [Streptomyces sp. B5E4]|uniref:cyclophilin-like fold protein n=1 Tax=Streptomyces sp. B5E4 TaxID=3153568 RepID=UPI00325DF02B